MRLVIGARANFIDRFANVVASRQLTAVDLSLEYFIVPSRRSIRQTKSAIIHVYFLFYKSISLFYL